jgi:hypothetical protein
MEEKPCLNSYRAKNNTVVIANIVILTVVKQVNISEFMDKYFWSDYGNKGAKWHGSSFLGLFL